MRPSNYFILSSFLVLLFLACTTNTYAQRAPVKVITGQITDSITKTPLANVTIRFETVGIGAGKVRTIKTDKNGIFKIRLSDHYFWNMYIEHPGYENYTVETVNGRVIKRRVNFSIRLKKIS